MNELVPQAVRDLLAFYSENHAEARFGDLNVSALQQAVASIDEVASEVQAAEAAVAQARERFHEVESELFAKAGRAISFLKIHVEQDAAQLAQLEAIGGALTGHRRKGKPAADASTSAPAEPRQRRTRKSKANAGADDSQTSSPEVLEEALLASDESELAPTQSSVVATETSNRSVAATPLA